MFYNILHRTSNYIDISSRSFIVQKSMVYAPIVGIRTIVWRI